MADIQEPQGGLAAAVERPTGMDEYSKARIALVEQQNKLLASLEERNKPQAFDFYASLARGFADPNAKLFSQGLGSAVGNLQDLNESQKVKNLQMYQIRSQVAQQQLEMQRQAMMSGMLQKEMFGDRSNPSGATNTANQASPRQTEMQSIFNKLDPTTQRIIFSLSGTNPDRAAEMLLKLGTEIASKNAVKPDPVREMEYYINQLPKESQEVARQVMAKAKVFGKDEDHTKLIVEFTAANKRGELSDADLKRTLDSLYQKIERISGRPKDAPARAVMAGSPESVRASLGRIEDPTERREALNAYEDQLVSSGQKDFGPSVNRATVADDRSKVSAGSNPVISNIPKNNSTNAAPTINAAVVNTTLPPAAIEKVTADIATTTGQERAKSDQKLYDESQTGFLSGRQLANNAKNLYSIVDKNKEAFEVLTGTGLGAGLVRLFDETFQVGEYRAGMPAFRAALGQVIRSDDQQEAFIAGMQSRQFINAAITAEQNKGQGTVTNMERLMYADAGAGNADTPAMLKYKAEFLMAKGQFNQFLHNKMHEARANGISPSDFINSPQYRQYLNDYDKSLMKIRSVYIK